MSERTKPTGPGIYRGRPVIPQKRDDDPIDDELQRLNRAIEEGGGDPIVVDEAERKRELEALLDGDRLDSLKRRLVGEAKKDGTDPATVASEIAVVQCGFATIKEVLRWRREGSAEEGAALRMGYRLSNYQEAT